MRTCTRLAPDLYDAGRRYALLWSIPLGVVMASALAEFLERRREADIGPLPNAPGARRGPRSRADTLADAATLIGSASRGGRPLSR